MSLGDRDAAMQRFARALDVPNGDRLGVRLAIAQVFMRQGHSDDVRRQLALGFAEARTKAILRYRRKTFWRRPIFFSAFMISIWPKLTSIRRSWREPIHDWWRLAWPILMWLKGETHKAEDALASLGPVSNFTDDYDYMIAAANVYRQRQDTVQALSSFVQANTVAGQDNQAMTQTAQNEVAIEEGHADQSEY